MGSVSDVYTTGDNDPQIEPEQFVRHYLYCDACGSFDLETWMSDGGTAIPQHRQWIAKAAIVVLPILAVVAALVSGMSGCSLWVVLTSVAVLVIGMLLTGAASAFNRQPMGMRCTRCKATYANGSRFFTDLDANPHCLRVSDVPRPLGRSPFLRGRSL